MRLDVKIVEAGHAPTLVEARALIMAGDVLVDDQRQDKPGTLIKEIQAVRVRERSRFVSRGGDKLWGAVVDLGIADFFDDACVLDCGASTGGFTDCALQLKARKVYALDVGFNQLDWKLRTDPRVVSMESTDIRALDQPLDPDIGLVLADISFNSLDRTIKAMRAAVSRPAVYFLLLVKPQFELDASAIPQAGVVDDPKLLQAAIGKVQVALEREGLALIAVANSRIRGREGNQEVFVWVRSLPRE